MNSKKSAIAAISAVGAGMVFAAGAEAASVNYTGGACSGVQTLGLSTTGNPVFALTTCQLDTINLYGPDTNTSGVGSVSAPRVYGVYGTYSACVGSVCVSEQVCC